MSRLRRVAGKAACFIHRLGGRWHLLTSVPSFGTLDALERAMLAPDGAADLTDGVEETRAEADAIEERAGEKLNRERRSNPFDARVFPYDAVMAMRLTLSPQLAGALDPVELKGRH